MKHDPIPLVAVDAKTLRLALMRAAQVIERNNKIPVLECARLTAEGGALSVAATDCDMELRVEVEAETSGTLDVLVRPARVLMFLTGVRGPVEITLSEDILELRAGDRRMRVRLVIPVSDWPVFRWKEGDAAIFGETDLRKTLAMTAIAVSNEETRYYLNGVHVFAKDGNAVFEATDGHRLIQRTIPGQEWSFGHAIIPKKAVQIVIANCARAGNGRIAVTARPEPEIKGARAIEFMGEHWRLRTKLIIGTFPDTARVIPAAAAEPPITFAVSLETLRGMRGTGDIGAGVDFYPEEGVAVYYDVPAEIEVTAPITGRGEPVSFNPKYLRDVCRAVGPVRVQCNRRGDPALLVCEDPDVTAVVMPRRTDNARLKPRRAA